MKSILTFDNAKTIKGEKIGYLTAILYMAPSDISGYQVCPMAKLAGCENACLYRAGLGGVYPSVQLARINKAKLFFENRAEFHVQLVCSIAQVIRAAMFQGNRPLIRLNGTSDIRHENYPVSIDKKTAAYVLKTCGFVVPVGDYENIFAVFPEIQFYDYTKIANRKNIPANYDLTFSYSGVVSFERFNQAAIDSGARIAAVFRRQKDIPASFKGLQCIDGDNTDVRHIEPRGVIVALYAKGPARKDTSGFVIDTAAA